MTTLYKLVEKIRKKDLNFSKMRSELVISNLNGSDFSDFGPAGVKS